MKVQLINAPNERQVHQSGSASYYPHLGLLSIATYLRQQRPDIHIEIIDGSITPLTDIVQRLSADVVGVSVLTPTYVPALEIAKEAKKRGATTVFGNDHATNLYKTILTNRPEVDYVVCGDHGEIPLERLLHYLEGRIAKQAVPNLAYRCAGEVTVNRGVRIGIQGEQSDPKGFTRYPLDAFPIPDRTLIEKVDTYFTNYDKDYGKFHNARVRQTTINIARGCGWGESDERRCSFCDIYDLTKRTTTPQRVWQEVKELQTLGYNLLYEVCDSFTSFTGGKKSFVDALLAAKPKGVNPEWFVYARASELYHANTVDVLKAFDVKRVNIGIDAADDNVLRGMSKGASERINRIAIEKCAASGLQMYISFVFGSMGETSESLEKTYRFIEDIVQDDHIVAIDPSVLLPLPNSPVWKSMMDPMVGVKVGKRIGFVPKYADDFKQKYDSVDILPTDELAQDWVKTFCDCTYDEIIDVRDRILNLQKSGQFVFGGFGVRGF